MEATLHALRAARLKMAVPKFSAIHRGSPVNIVLKADQRTGRLTTGHVAELLTRGDHPRGVKVRLGDGQVGRVQSFGSGPVKQISMTEVGVDEELDFARGSAAAPTTAAEEPAQGTWSTRTLGGVGTGGGVRGGRLQDDVRNDPVPVEERSLEDYIKKPSKNKMKKGRGKQTLPPAEEVSEKEGYEAESSPIGDWGTRTMQEQLQEEFPKLDSALIAAILADHGGGDAARVVLKGLS